MRLRAIILGCGSSGGVPRIGGPGGRGNWGNCDPAELKNRRTRCSLIVQRADESLGWDAPELTTLLIDTSPNLREQLLNNHIGRLDAVLYTHDHADQTHGIDDLRVLSLMGRYRVPVYVNEKTCPNLLQRFDYCFQDNPKTGYPAILNHHVMPQPGETFEIDGPTGPIPIMSILVTHGPVNALGFRFGLPQADIAYSPDLNDISETSFCHFKGCHSWIVDALRYKPHVSHAHLSRSLDWIDRAGVQHGVLTNLHIDLDYRTVMAETPEHVEPAYDGMVIEPTAFSCRT